MLKKSFLFGLGILASTLLPASEIRSVKAVPVSGRIVLDGKITESAWQKTPWQGNFLRLDGQKAAEQTRFKVLTGKNGLFFAFDAADRSLRSVHTKHDGPLWADDCIEIFLYPKSQPDSDVNIREYRHFIFNPSAAQYEQSVKGGVGVPAWNTPWKVSVSKNSSGYTAEVFIPYHALAPFSECKNWRFNVARENRGNISEITSWSPLQTFKEMEKFGVLKEIPVDLSAYSSTFYTSEIRMQSEKGKVIPALTGVLNGKEKTIYTVQVAVRDPAGKLCAFNSADVTPLRGKTNFSISLPLASSGKYVLQTAVMDLQGKIVGYEERTSVIHIASFEAKMIEPHYRNYIYLALPAPKLVLDIRQFVSLPSKNNIRLTVTVRNKNGKVTAGKVIKNPAKIQQVSFSAENFAPGDYTVQAALQGTGKHDGVFTLDFSVIPKRAKGNLITLDTGRRVLINGKKFFPRGFYGYTALPSLQKSSFNILIHSHLNMFDIDQIIKRLDEVHRYGIKLAFPPRFKTKGDFFGFWEKGKKVTSLSQEAYARMEKMVKAVKDHPAFFGWWLYDEPRGAELLAELKKQYEFLKKIDPEHPVLGGDNSPGGCILKQGYCDIHVLDMYYNPQFNGKAEIPVNTLAASVQQIHDVARKEGVWYMPQAFNHGTFYKKEFPTPTYRETRASVFGTIAAGASGMVPYKVGQEGLQYYQRHTNSGIFFSPEMKVGWLSGLGPELKNLEQVLLSDAREVKCSSSKLKVSSSKYKGKNFVIAVNVQVTPVQAQIFWPDRKVKTVRILGEKRTQNMKNGVIAKTFAPLEVGIYTDDMTYPEGVNVSAVEEKIASEIRKYKKK